MLITAWTTGVHRVVMNGNSNNNNTRLEYLSVFPPFLPKSLPVLIPPTHGRMARLSGPGWLG